jgi:uncharacterized membrane protein (UPF0182 family)
MRWASEEGDPTSAAVAVLGAAAVFLEIVFFVGLRGLGELSLEKLGVAMLILALLTAITAITVQALAKDPSRQDDPYVTANAGFLRLARGLMQRFAAVAAVLGAATAGLGIVT